MTGYWQADHVQRSRDAGFALHFVKPVNLERLSEAIEGALVAPTTGDSRASVAQFEYAPPAMSVQQRNNVQVSGSGAATLYFAHGFGCDQHMWRLLAPAYSARYRVVLFDLVGCGGSDLRAYDREKYGTLRGHAGDVLEIAHELDDGRPAIFVGHSVSAMIGLFAGIEEPARFAAQIMIGPSPCYINDGGYVGGFERTI